MDLDNIYPILEYDGSTPAMLEPSRMMKAIDMPVCAVACFFQDVIAQLVKEHQAKRIYSLRSEIGSHPVYELEFQDKRLALFHPGVGAPLAAGILEEVIALGARTFMACGGAGVLDSSINVGHVIVPSAAIRDEGTSYHYLPPSREVATDPLVLSTIERVLQEQQISYIVTKTWTTDAIYRETPQKVRLRRQEGCRAVEMEAATFLAVAKFRGVRFGQLLYGGDDVGGEVWDGRSWHAHTVREKLFWLAATACLEIEYGTQEENQTPQG